MLLLCSLDISNWIDIIGIGINAVLGIVIVLIVSSRVSNKRALKDYFINEIKDVRDCYRKFLNELLGGRCDFNITNNWFQVMNMRLTDLERVLNESYSNLKLPTKELNQELRDLLTSSDDFNNSFNKPSISINQLLKQAIYKKHSEISTSLIKTVVKINKL
jgi:hypothetical protein